MLLTEVLILEIIGVEVCRVSGTKESPVMEPGVDGGEFGICWVGKVNLSAPVGTCIMD